MTPDIAEAMSRRDVQRAQTRARLFHAAIDEFRRSGVAEAEIGDIVDAAGVARGTFYFHFPTKDHVLVELQQRLEEEVVEHLEPLRSAEPATRPSIREVMAECVAAVEQSAADVDDARLVREVMALFIRQPELPMVGDQPFPLAGELEYHFARAADAGAVRSDVKPQQLAAVFLSSLFGFLISHSVPDDERDIDADTFVDVLLQGMAP